MSEVIETIKSNPKTQQNLEIIIEKFSNDSNKSESQRGQNALPVKNQMGRRYISCERPSTM